MKKIALVSMIVLSASLLQGCAVAIIGAGVGATKVATDPRTAGTQIDDNTLDARISAKFAEQQNKDYFKNTRIVASAYNGSVLLIGQAQSQQQIARAASLVESIDGVSKVYNQIHIGDVIGAGTIAKDAWITTKVKTKLVGNAETKARDIKVITENGEVFLIGIVSRAEGRVAAEIASKVDGVRLVSTIFTYSN